MVGAPSLGVVVVAAEAAAAAAGCAPSLGVVATAAVATATAGTAVAGAAVAGTAIAESLEQINRTQTRLERCPGQCSDYSESQSQSSPFDFGPPSSSLYESVSQHAAQLARHHGPPHSKRDQTNSVQDCEGAWYPEVHEDVVLASIVAAPWPVRDANREPKECGQTVRDGHDLTKRGDRCECRASTQKDK